MIDFYKDKKVVVTGGAGFVGAQLVRELMYAGAHVVVVDNYSHGKNKYAGAEYVPGDAGNRGTCNYAFRNRSTRGDPVDVVFNLAAAVAGVLYNAGHHHEMFNGNILLQTVPVAVADEIGVPVFVQTSSVCVYGPDVNHPSSTNVPLIQEPHPANAGYAWSKRVGEEAIKWSNIKRPVIVRPSNIFGPHDYFDDKPHVIPALIKKFVHDDVIQVYGPRLTMREFIHSNDVALGMMSAAAYGEPYSIHNLGCSSENTVTIEELVNMIAEIVGVDKEIVYNEDVGGGDPLRWSECRETQQLLNWKHKVSLEDGLKETIEWYKSTLTD